MRAWPTVLVAVLAASAGFAGGRVSRAPAAKSSPVAVAHEDDARAVGPSPQLALFAQRAQLATLLRDVVREELVRSRLGDAATVKSAADSAHAPTSDASPDPTPEQVAARHNGQTLIATARRAGRWTDDDRQSFRLAMAEADGAGQLELQRALVLAINSQELKIEGRGSPF